MFTRSTRPQLKADTHFAPLSEGIYLRRNNSRLILKGKSLYPLLEHLAPYLNGRATLEELTTGLDTDRQRMVTRLLEKLFDRDFLHDASQNQPHTLDQADLAAYAHDLTFIESFQPSAPEHFARFQQQRLLLLGSGLSFEALLQASLQTGVKQIAALPTEADVELSEDVMARLTRAMDAAIWEEEAELRKALRDYDALLFIAEQPMLERACLLNRVCRAEDKTLLQAVVVDGRAWLGPLVTPDTGGCWECAWRRLQAAGAARTEEPARYALRDQPEFAPARPLSLPEATMIAYRLLFSLFQHVTRAGLPDAVLQLHTLDLATYMSEGHAFQPHPHCRACQEAAPLTAAQFVAQVRELQEQPALEAETFMNNLDTCVDEQLGLFTAFDTRDFVQAPLAVYQIELAHPQLPADGAQPRRVIAVSTDNREAVMRAARKACEHYAASLVDEHRLLSAEDAREAAVPLISSAELGGQAARDERWTWASDLHTQEAVLVPADLAFALPGAEGRGLAAGQSWDEALCLALLDRCNELTVRHLLDARQEYSRVDLERAILTPMGVHLFHLLKAAGGPLAVYDVTGALGVPTFATCCSGRVVAYSTHCDTAQALALGLECAVQHYQSEQFQQSDYALTPLADLPARLRGTRLSTPHTVMAEAWSARLAWLLQRLQENGLRAFAVPLNHDPALARALPFIVRVLVSGKEWQKGA
ncbi:MAG TPA: TOMM precursor leader peptide-binding protein [Ktedonobacteraceae bacterium]|nr:TOMM precursor leader peptide-binding protein [Ktedonobacteraceae bacterium]